MNEYCLAIALAGANLSGSDEFALRVVIRFADIFEIFLKFIQKLIDILWVIGVYSTSFLLFQMPES